MMAKKCLIIFISAFFLNLLWEEAHSVLYLHYKAAAITDIILLRAALFDAGIITLFSFVFSHFELHRKEHWLLVVALVVFSIGLEKWALATGRWAYTDVMPIIPLLSVGLTPTIQLGLLWYFSQRISDFWENRLR